MDDDNVVVVVVIVVVVVVVVIIMMMMMITIFVILLMIIMLMMVMIIIVMMITIVKFKFVSVCAPDGIISLGKANKCIAPSLSSLPKVALKTVPMTCVSAASFLHSSLLQAISAVMFWSVYVQKVPKASKYLCSAKLQTRCDVCCACQSICLFIPSE